MGEGGSEISVQDYSYSEGLIRARVLISLLKGVNGPRLTLRSLP